MRALLVCVLIGCGAPAVAPVPKVASTKATMPPPPAAPDPQNFGFEAELRGWQPRGDGYRTTIVADAHGGTHALLLEATESAGQFGTVIGSIPAAPYRGKHVTLSAWLRTQGVAGTASLFLRVDGPPDGGDFDNTTERPVTGTTGWQHVSVEVDVAADATDLVYGPLLLGGGKAWYDDLALAVTGAAAPEAPPHPIAIAGTITGPAGPLADAVVSLVGRAEIVETVRTDAAGHYRFTAPSGAYGISAAHAGVTGGFTAPKPLTADATLDLALAAADGVTVRGKVTPPHAAALQIARMSNDDGDVWAVRTGADGAFSVVLPRADAYSILSTEGVVGELGTAKRSGDLAEVTVSLPVFAPPVAAVDAYVKAHAIPLATAEAGHGFADMAPLAAVVGTAPIVALGEATHGSREFFQLKHRMLEYLVAERGFTLFAIEANEPECRAINDYVLHGTGTAREALAGIYFWTWNTEEVLAMIEWMRTWNASHAKHVQFLGFDMQTPNVAYQSVAAFLAAHDPGAAKLVEGAKLVGVAGSAPPLAQHPAAERAQLARAVDALAAEFDAHPEWASDAAFVDAKHDARLLQQFMALVEGDATGGATAGDLDARDRGMAENVAWLHDTHPGERMMLWAHNGHIASTEPHWANMGSLLKAKYRAAYVNIGFVFGEGAFQAIDFRADKRGLREITLGPAPANDASTPFTHTGHALLALDLRKLPARGPVHDWFAAPHPTRETGAAYTSEANMTTAVELPARYDAVLFVAKTTRARPLH